VIRCLLWSVLLFEALSIFALPPVHGSDGAATCSSCPGDINNDQRVTIDEILTVVNTALDSCPTPGPSQSTLLKTGQTECDQGNQMLAACPGAPEGQDGEVQAGVPRSYSDNGDGTIQDNVTGLTWEKLSSDDSIHDWNQTYTWNDAFRKITVLNSTCFATHCDWRLPNRRELESLIDAGDFSPAINPAFNTACTPPAPGCDVTACSCTQLDYYWSSTTDESNPINAWAVDANIGSVNPGDKSLPFYVRAVRGGV
jgi:hypothetical protein